MSVLYIDSVKLTQNEPSEDEAATKIDISTLTDTPKYMQVKSDAACLKTDSPFALVRHEQKKIDETNASVTPFIINDRTLVPVRFSELASGEKASFYKDILWYNSENIAADVSLALDYKFYETDPLSRRSSWTDENQLFIGLHGGSNMSNHCNLDSGTFIFDALDTRWFMDFGSDNYNLSDYWAKGTGGNNGSIMCSAQRDTIHLL